MSETILNEITTEKHRIEERLVIVRQLIGLYRNRPSIDDFILKAIEHEPLSIWEIYNLSNKNNIDFTYNDISSQIRSLLRRKSIIGFKPKGKPKKYSLA